MCRRGISLFVYLWHQLEQDAQAGDLFACHLAQEAKALVDPGNYLARLKRSFEFRESYEDEFNRASDLGWYLAQDS